MKGGGGMCSSADPDCPMKKSPKSSNPAVWNATYQMEYRNALNMGFSPKEAESWAKDSADVRVMTGESEKETKRLMRQQKRIDRELSRKIR